MDISNSLTSPALFGATDPSISELDYVVCNFDSNFANWRGKRIVLHGSREYARAIIGAFDDSYHFIAVATSECESRSFAGKEVWSSGRLLAEKPDLIILTERVRHAEAVYQEIGPACRMSGIPLFDMYGLDWLEMRDEIDGQGTRTLEQWLDIIMPYDIVSFEMPDCFMMPNPQSEGAPLICRMSTLSLAKHIVSSGKKLLFIGRRPYTIEEQVESLAASELVGRDEDVRGLFFMRDGEDGAWRTIRATYPDARILHVGNGIPKESVLPRYYGVDTYRMIDGAITDEEWMCLESTIRKSLRPLELKAQLNAAIDLADIVAFDVFDTLLARTTLTPEDVFEIVQEKALDQHMRAEGFANARATAQSNPAALTIDEIYLAVQESLALTDDERDALREIELETEREVLIARDPLCNVFHQVLDAGKRVILVSDMYYSGSTLKQLLGENGITGYEKLLVSSDQRTLKRQGLLDSLLESSMPADRIVFIGNSPSDDIRQALSRGMQAILVPSPISLAFAYGLGRSLHADLTLDQRCELGAAIAEAFADPFAPRALRTLVGPAERHPDLHAPSLAAQGIPSFNESACIHVAPHNERVPIELRQALLFWYPFPTGSRALLLGSDREALAPLLEKHYATLETELSPGARYDLIVALDILDVDDTLQDTVIKLEGALKQDGVLLVGFRNRFGIKYLCGTIDDMVEHPFDTLSAEGKPGIHGRHEMKLHLESAGLLVRRTYYAMPEKNFVQAIYTDDYVPQSGIHDRVMPFDAHNSPLVAIERELYAAIVDEGMLPFVTNYYLMECRKPNAMRPGKQVSHVALSLDRGLERSFITTLFSDGTVLKAAAHPEGSASLKTLYENTEALRQRGIATVDARIEDNGLYMPLVREQPLLAHLDSLLPDNPAAFIGVFEQLYDDVLKSSEQTVIDETDSLRIWHVRAAELGPIMKTGYIDMIPYNAFWDHGVIRYYDQEFSIENCPARYVLFRALRYTYIHLSSAEKSIALDSLKNHFGLTRLWGSFMRREEDFVEENRNRDRYRMIYEWAHPNRREVAKRRKALARSTAEAADKPYGIGLLMGVFDLFHVGHLRLINRARARCRFLRVAVLADDVVQQFKNITPTIPLAQRMEILAAIDGVDEVVAIEGNPSRLEEWRRRPFDCFFSGDDYAGNEYWDWERKELEKRGATIEFFPYTKEQSSTSIRTMLSEFEKAELS